MSRSQRRMAAFNSKKAIDQAGNAPWDEDQEEEVRVFQPRARKPTLRSQAFKGNGNRPPPRQGKEKATPAGKATIADPAETLGVVKAKKEVLKDEPLWQEGPYTGTQPVRRAYSQNMDFSTFPILCERVYADLEAVNPRMRRELPFCAFQHAYTSILNAVVIDHVRTVNAEDRYADEESPLNLVAEDMVIPQPLSEYYKLIANSNTPQGDLIKVNVPEAGIPQPSIPEDGEDRPAVPSGTFGRITPETHNSYECYVSPYVTSKLIEETVRQNTERRFVDWNPLPVGAFPRGTSPNENLLGFRSRVERLHPESLGTLSDLEFPDADTMSGRLRWCAELMSRTSGHLQRLQDKYKMVVGRPTHGTNSAAIGWTRVAVAGTTNAEHNRMRITAINAPVNCSVALGSTQCNIVGLFGLKRERTANARGLCYTTDQGAAPADWNPHINDNFTMVGEFAPLVGVDFPALRAQVHTNAAPAGSRAESINTWTRRNFLID